MSKTFNELPTEELDALIIRVQEAIEYELALSPADCQLLLDALMTLANVQQNINSKDITILKLKKLIGMVQSSEKLKNSMSGAQSRSKKEQGNKSTKRKPSVDKVQPTLCHHKLDSLKKGMVCPECAAGKSAKYEPASFLRITGQTPFVPEKHIMERLRCNTCGSYFTASVSDDVIQDGASHQKYGYSARSLIVISKFYAGSPYYRQGSLQHLLGMPISASTCFDQAEHVANSVKPVFDYLLKLSGNAVHYHLDDTTHRILDQQPVMKKQRNSDKTKLRTGVYCSGVIARLTEHKKVVLFETNVGHSGEFIDSILQHRDRTLAPPIIMSDALASNRPSVGVPIIHSLCNSHSRRKFMDVITHFPDEVNDTLEKYQQIWIHDGEGKAKNWSEQERLAFHAQHSLPVMDEIRAWGNRHLAEGSVEENSGLGEAIRYLDKHYDGLTRFCHVLGAQLDNNLMEAELKLIVRDRKNAMFRKTLAGASIGDVLTSLIATAQQNDVNIFDYFNVLQQNQQDVAQHPENYLPWNYKR